MAGRLIASKMPAVCEVEHAYSLADAKNNPNSRQRFDNNICNNDKNDHDYANGDGDDDDSNNDNDDDDDDMRRRRMTMMITLGL